MTTDFNLSIKIDYLLCQNTFDRSITILREYFLLSTDSMIDSKRCIAALITNFPLLKQAVYYLIIPKSS